jgi:phage regulator Rha-like protein
MSENVPQVTIESKIHVIRGERVMLDRDLAELYEVETRILNQAVKRNAERFPADFMFQLTKEEADSLRSQIVILKRGQHLKYQPYAFTENGVAMLSAVINSPKAIEISIRIVRAFVRLREVITQNKDLHKAIQQIERRLDTHDRQIQIAFAAIKSLMQPPAPTPPPVEKPKRRMGFGPHPQARATRQTAKK